MSRVGGPADVTGHVGQGILGNMINKHGSHHGGKGGGISGVTIHVLGEGFLGPGWRQTWRLTWQ